MAVLLSTGLGALLICGASALSQPPRPPPPGAAEIEAARRQGFMLYKQGKYRDAVSQLERAIELGNEAYGKDHVETAGLMNNAAAVYVELGEYAKAESLYLQSIE